MHMQAALPTLTWLVLASHCAHSLRTGGFNLGFAYRQIAKSIIGKPADRIAEACEQACFDEQECVSWQVCTPLGGGCDGCYLLRNRPELLSVEGWYAGVLEDRAQSRNLAVGEHVPVPSNVTMPTTLEGCEEFLLSANGGAPDSNLDLSVYNRCGDMLRQADSKKSITVQGQHWPTSLVLHFREPELALPQDLEEQIKGPGEAVAPDVYEPFGAPGSLTAELHGSSETQVLRRTQRHAFVLPFYDTNIAHGIMQLGTMNVMQSYEMQALLQPGDVVVDAGANLGSYTIPFAERVGIHGKVLAFEPFRALYQLTTANVAINGLSNVWTYNLALGEGRRSFTSRPPQLRFFSSPGGVKVNYAEHAGEAGAQEKDMNMNQAVQMYDFELEPEETLMVSLDELLMGNSDIKVPPMPNLRLIKIDVEGMERNVVLGAQRAIQHFKPIIWSENVDYFEKNDMGFLQTMEQMGYVCAKVSSAPQDLLCSDATLGMGRPPVR